jgi:hypothetical protein
MARVNTTERFYFRPTFLYTPENLHFSIPEIILQRDRVMSLARPRKYRGRRR